MKSSLNRNYAAIDLGTNSVRLLIVDSENNVILTQSERVVIGEGMFSTNTFTEEAITRTVSAFESFRKTIDENNVVQIRAVGTAACRASKNVGVLIREIKEKTDIDLEVISGEEEAYLTTLGAAGVLKNKKKYTFFCDIGGGSTELILTENSKKMKIVDSVSIPYGGKNISEILSVFSYDKNVTKKISNLVLPYIEKFIDKNNIKDKLHEMDFIGISGAVLRIAAIVNETKEYDRNKAHGLTIEKSKFDIFFETYQKMSFAMLENSPYIGEGRVSVFVSASIIFAKVFQSIGANKAIASLSGIKEGVAISMINN